MTTLEINHQIASMRSVMRQFTRRFTKDREEASDLIQDTILKALIHRHKFREDTNLKAWLFIIMRNTFINNYRKEQRFRLSQDHSKDLYLLNTEDTHTFSGPAASLEYHEIWKNVDELSEELRVPFKMYESGYKYQEIADHVQIPLGTVKNRIFQARKEIQRKLAGY